MAASFAGNRAALSADSAFVSCGVTALFQTFWIVVVFVLFLLFHLGVKLFQTILLVAKDLFVFVTNMFMGSFLGPLPA